MIYAALSGYGIKTVFYYLFDKVVNRNVYRTIHKDLQKHLKNKFGFEVHILNGASASRNIAIQELKAENHKEEEHKTLEKANLEHRELAIATEQYLDMSDIDKVIRIIELVKENAKLTADAKLLQQLKAFVKNVIEFLRKNNVTRIADTLEARYKKIVKEKFITIKREEKEVKR